MASLTAKFQLLRGLLHGEQALAGPVWLHVEVTRRCNLVCLGCFSHCPGAQRGKPANFAVQDLPPELVEKICAELPPLGTREILLVGEGEAFLHPRLFDYLAAFKGAGLRLGLFTNGTLVDEPAARRLVESGLDLLYVTLWGVNREEYSRAHPGVRLNLLDNTIGALYLIAQAKRKAARRTPRLVLALPLNRHNFANLKERAELALACGCDAVEYGYFRDWGGKYQHLTLSPADVESIRPALEAVGERLEGGGVRHNTKAYLARAQLGHQAWREFPCYAGWYTAYAYADGTVVPCTHCRLPMGNLKEVSFAKIWDSPQYREFRRRTGTRAGLAALRQTCDCANCCLVRDNERVYRVFRWFAPLARKTAEPEHTYPAAG